MGTHKFKINGKAYEVSINSINGSNADVTVNGARYSVEIGNRSSEPAATPSSQPGTTKPETAHASSIKSPLPGVILEVNVREGQSVRRGQKLAVIEAMKMENEIQAETDGTVTAVLVQKGDSVLEGAEIIKLR